MRSAASLPARRADTVFERVASAARERIHADRPLRRNVPGGGRVSVDRALPFVVVHRPIPGRVDEGTAELVTALASWAVLPGDDRYAAEVSDLVRAISEAASERLGAFLLIEIWSSDTRPGSRAPVEPAVRLHVPAGVHEAAEDLRAALAELRLMEDEGELGAPVALCTPQVVEDAAIAPPGLAPLEVAARGMRVGIEIAPFYRDPVTAEAYPRVVNVLRRELARAIERSVYSFSQERTSLDLPHARALGRQHVSRADLHVDRRLSEVYGAFDTLLLVTPINTAEAWQSFKDARFERAPTFRYRPLPFDPEHLKRRLYHVPIERVEDPLLNHLFREKQEELDREISLLRSLGTPRFRWASYELHGVVEDDLASLAERILALLPLEDQEEYAEESAPEPGYVDAKAFERAAHAELDLYRQLSPSFTGAVEIWPDVTAGLMVNKGVLCISESLRIPRHRLQPLLHHEIGTHVVTYSNGMAQPFKIFASGLAGYDALQEGLAVLSEWLCGGLTRARARVLAGRVVGIAALVDGADFVETFRRLVDEHGFPDHTAFIVTTRIYRGGGLTKDAQYLRGLRELLAYLRGEGTLEPLFVGKLGISHIPAVQELVLRGVLHIPPVKPRWASDLAVMERLGACRRMDVMDLIETTTRRTDDLR